MRSKFSTQFSLGTSRIDELRAVTPLRTRGKSASSEKFVASEAVKESEDEHEEPEIVQVKREPCNLKRKKDLDDYCSTVPVFGFISSH